MVSFSITECAYGPYQELNQKKKHPTTCNHALNPPSGKSGGLLCGIVSIGGEGSSP